MKVVCVLLAALFAEAYCFSGGPPGIADTTPVVITLIDGSTLMAPRGIVACDMMTPGHANVRPQNPNGNGGYFVNHDVPEGSYAASTPYNVEVRGTTAQFRGFMVQARNAAGMLIGTFTERNGANNTIGVQTLDCDAVGSNSESVMIHSNAAPGTIETSSVLLTWTSPADTGDVTFTYTVVRGFSTVFTQMNATAIGNTSVSPFEPTLEPPTTVGTTPTTPSMGPTLPPSTPSPNVADYQTETFGGVTFGATLNTGNPTGYLDIFLSATASGWVAIGFSPTPTMVNSDVIGCSVMADGTTVEVLDTYNVAEFRFNEPDVGDGSDFMMGSASFEDGVITCTFTRRARGNDVDVIVNNVIRNQDFDLFDEDGYFLLYGRGNSRNDLSFPMHEVTPTISSARVVFGGITTLPPSTPSPNVADFQTGTFGGVTFGFRLNTGNPTDFLDIFLSARASGWVAIGFSRTPTMVDSDVIGCSVMADGTTVEVLDTYNVAEFRFNEPDVGDGSDFIMGSASFEDGVITCTFTRRARGNDFGAPVNNVIRDQDFDLFDEDGYFLLYGRGNSRNELSFPMHEVTPIISGARAVFGGVNNTNTTLPPAGVDHSGNLLRAHGVFMIISWGLLGLTGIYFAAWMKPLYPKGWFQVHRAFMLGSLFTGAIGFILAFVSQYESPTPGLITLGSRNPTGTAHFVLGIIIMALHIVNPIISAFRCKPDEKNRWIFNLVHGALIGLVAELLALTNMGIGLSIWGPMLSRQGNLTFFWVYLAFVIYFLTLVVLQIIIYTVFAIKAEPKDRAKIAPSLIKPLVSEPASEKDQNIEMSPAGGDGGDGGEKPVQGAAASDGNCQKCGKGCKCKCKGARGGHYTARWVFYGLFIGVLPGIMLSILINICLPPRS